MRAQFEVIFDQYEVDSDLKSYILGDSDQLLDSFSLPHLWDRALGKCYKAAGAEHEYMLRCFRVMIFRGKLEMLANLIFKKMVPNNLFNLAKESKTFVEDIVACCYNQNADQLYEFIQNRPIHGDYWRFHYHCYLIDQQRFGELIVEQILGDTTLNYYLYDFLKRIDDDRIRERLLKRSVIETVITGRLKDDDIRLFEAYLNGEDPEGIRDLFDRMFFEQARDDYYNNPFHDLHYFLIKKDQFPLFTRIALMVEPAYTFNHYLSRVYCTGGEEWEPFSQMVTDLLKQDQKNIKQVKQMLRLRKMSKLRAIAITILSEWQHKETKKLFEKAINVEQDEQLKKRMENYLKGRRRSN